jgi:adenylylsulfate kinase
MIISLTAGGEQRNNRFRHEGATVWFTGLSGAGKSTIANAVHRYLVAENMRVQVLDADSVRNSLCRDLGFTKEDRDENVRRIGFVSDLLTRQGVIVLVAAISPYRSTRAEIRASIQNFLEVYVSTPLCICEERDTKGLYRRARSGTLPNFTGVDDPYEEPLNPNLRLDTAITSLDDCVAQVVNRLQQYRLSKSVDI